MHLPQANHPEQIQLIEPAQHAQHCRSATACEHSCPELRLMSHNWLHTPDCEVLNEMRNESITPT